jgi:hypothetical protein
MTPAAQVAVHLVVAAGMLVIVPIGLRLIDDPRLATPRRW